MAAQFEWRGKPLSRRQFFLAAAALAPGSRLLAADDTKFSTDVHVVNVLVTVRDKQGKIVRNLTKNDFTVTEDGRTQSIKYFAQQSDIPLTLGLLVDTSMSQRRLIDTERDASFRFFEQVLREDKDMAFLIHFDHEVELLQDLTMSRQQLQKALDLLKTPTQGQGGGRRNPQGGGNRGGYPGGPYPGGGGGGGRGRGGGGTALYDSVLLASDELMKKQSGRKADILLTDGVDAGSKVSISTAIESAQRADTLLYSVRFYDEQAYGGGMGPRMGGGRRGGRRMPPPGGRPDGKKILERLSKETGGGYFEVSKKHSITDIYHEIEEELRNQYNIGYTSDKPGGAGEFRKIQVTLKQKGLVVRARDGYYAKSTPNAS
jgi:VWFA-related protein